MSTSLATDLQEALSELLLTMADDEFIAGFRDSEWTGIAPMLEEDVAFSSLAQDEIGHARALYQLRSTLTGEDPDRVAYDRQAEEYRHCRLLDHPRTDWAFTITRRYLYDSADAIRLEALVKASWPPLRGLLDKVRREERYHLQHLDAWIERLARGGPDARRRLTAALKAAWPDVLSPFAPLTSEPVLIEGGILSQPMAQLSGRFSSNLAARLARAGIPLPGPWPSLAAGRRRSGAPDGFHWLWSEFTSVRASEPGATW
jgi:ring-1,2-phenylacetyl-CoA epoxidase subunit PaaC